MRRLLASALILFSGAVGGMPSEGQDGGANSSGAKEEVRLAVASYVAAFNDRDVDKLISHWAPEGIYRSRITGEQVVGHSAMAEEFKTIFSNPKAPRLQVATKTIELISPSVALETGVATVMHADDRVDLTDYRVVFVKQGGSWLIDRVSEEEVSVQLSNYDQLKPLEWLIGEWVDQDSSSTIEIAARWTKNQNFISRNYTVKEAGETVSSGLQIIGWDASEQQICSWLFDSDGGVVTGKWRQRDDRWVVSSVAKLGNGLKGSFTSVFRPISGDRYGWQKVNRMLDGTLLPNIDEVVVRRK